jgi:hypothetical protein
MSTDGPGTGSLPILSNLPDEPTDTLAQEWRNAGIAFAVLLALLTVGVWATSARGDQRGSASIPVIHESF